MCVSIISLAHRNGTLSAHVLCNLSCRELLEKYSQCKTSAEVIAVQNRWLEAERGKVKSDDIDYPPSSSSSGSDDEAGEDIGANGSEDDRRCNW